MLPQDAVSTLSSAASPSEIRSHCRVLRTAVLYGACHPRVGCLSPLALLPLPLLQKILDLALPMAPTLELEWLLQEWMPGDSSSSSSSDEGSSEEEGNDSDSSDEYSDYSSSSLSNNSGAEAGNGGNGGNNGRGSGGRGIRGRGMASRGGRGQGSIRGRARGYVINTPNDLQTVLKWV